MNQDFYLRKGLVSMKNLYFMYFNLFAIIGKVRRLKRLPIRGYLNVQLVTLKVCFVVLFWLFVVLVFGLLIENQTEMLPIPTTQLIAGEQT